MTSLEDILIDHTEVIIRRGHDVHTYTVPHKSLSAIEAELLAPLKAENARLTAQVAAGRKLRSDMAYFLHGLPESSNESTEVHEAIRRYDAATAPADAEYDEDEAEDDALAAYAEDMGAPADADPMNAMNAHSDPINEYAFVEDLYERIEQHERGITNMSKRLEELYEEFGQYREISQQRIDELAARVDFLHSDTDKRLIPLESPSLASELGSRSVFEIAKINSQFNKLHYRIEKLEAARQEPPQPTPSAPVVVTDAVVDRACNAAKGRARGRGHLFHMEHDDMRAALEAAFVAWDREVQDASN